MRDEDCADGGAGSKRGCAGAVPEPLPFQQQLGERHYESPCPKIHNANRGSRRPTPDKALPKTTRPVR